MRKTYRRAGVLMTARDGRAGRYLGSVTDAVDVHESSYLKHLRGLEEGGQLFLADVYLAVVHESQQRLHVGARYVPQDHDRMLAWICLQRKNCSSNFIRV